MLSDSTNGYIYRFQVYTGKACESADATVGLCSHSVLDLMQGLEENHHKLITDNYYTSPEFFCTCILRESMSVALSARVDKDLRRQLCHKIG